MPTYDYECGACGWRFEKFQPITARAIRKCPKCGQRKVRRRIGTGAGIIFKGSGFYATDYRSASYQKEAKEDGAPAAGEDKPSGAKGDKGGKGKAEANGEGSAKGTSDEQVDGPGR